jgi:putative addiction module component (TIGR02574 family)
MKSTPILSEALALPVPERIALVEAIWESIAHSDEAIQLSAGQEAELDRRLAESRKNPDSGIAWEAVYAGLTAKHKAG